MKHTSKTAATRGILLSLMAVMLAGALALLQPAGPALRAEPAATITVTPYLTEFGYAPAVFGAVTGPTPTVTVPAATVTPFASPTTTPEGGATPTATVQPGATSTATATVTATATQPPDLEPTPDTSPLRVLETHALTTEPGGRLMMRGEITNDGPRPVEGIRLPIEFRNKKGRLVHTETALPMLHQLGAGEKICFAVGLEPPIGWRTYEFGDLAYQIDPDPTGGLQVSGVSGELDALMGWYALSGNVANASSADYRLLRLAATLYDPAGMVVGCDFAYTDNSSLGAGQADRFEFLFADREYPDAVSWHITAEGERR